MVYSSRDRMVLTVYRRLSTHSFPGRYGTDGARAIVVAIPRVNGFMTDLLENRPSVGQSSTNCTLLSDFFRCSTFP